MSRINKIEEAILELEGGAYQKLVDEYLFKKYKFKNIQPLGVQTGTNKTTKGIPDTFVYTENDKYILICYGTVTAQPVDKIEKDISACLNKAKLCLEDNKIEKIICGFTSSNVHIEEFETLKNALCEKGIGVELISIGTLAHDLLTFYPQLAYDHLGISLDTHQIFDIEDFVKVYDKNGTNSPVNTKFGFRKKELGSIYNSIKSNLITCITGPSGIGKTRLALEVCRNFELEGWKVFCVRSNRRSLYEDIDYYLDCPGKYLFFMDDANNVSCFEGTLDYLLKRKNVGEVKILITVRDYVKNEIFKVANEFLSTQEIEIDKLSKTEIQDILKSNYNIKNPDYLKRITDVANGNIRLAILAGIRAVDSGYKAIVNVEDIFKNYYTPIVDNIGINKSELIYLFLIALLGAVRYKNDQVYQELKTEYINDIVEEPILEKLCDFEIIDWFEKEVVNISDQSLGNYILYFTIFEKKWVDLVSLIQKLFPERRKRIIYALNTLTNLFYSKELMDFINNSVNKAWDGADKRIEKDYVEAFYVVNPIKGLIYLKSYVEKERKVDFNLKSFDIESKKNYNNVNTKEINILANYKNTKNFSDAIELLIAFYAKRPDLFMDFFFAIKNRIVFDKDSFKYKYSNEILFLELLWKQCKEGQEYNNTLLFLHSAREFLRTEFTFSEPEGKRAYAWIRWKIVVCNEIKQLRNSIWNALFILYDDSNYHELVLNILANIYIDGLEKNELLELWDSDFNFIYKFYEKKAALDFDDIFVLSRFRNILLTVKNENDERFNILDSYYVYNIYKLLTINYSTSFSWKESQDKRHEEIYKTIQNYQAKDYDRMFQACRVIEKSISGNKGDISTGVTVVFECLEKDKALYYNNVKSYLNNGAPFGDTQYDIVPYLVSNFGYEKTIELINNAEFDLKEQWLFSIWLRIPEEAISDTIAKDCINFLRQQLKNSDSPITFSLLQLKRYLKYDSSILREILDYLINNPKRIYTFLPAAHNNEELSIIKELFKDKMEILEELYYSCDDRTFDYHGNLFWILYKHNEKRAWVKLILKIKNTLKTKYIIDGYNFNTIFQRIWKEPCYSERIDYAFKEMIKDTYRLYSEEAKLIFGETENCLEESKKKKWILDTIDKNIKDLDTVIKVLDIVIYVYPSWKNDVLLHFLEIDKNFENFKQLPLHPMSKTWSGSEIPLINSEIKELEVLCSKIKGIEYLEHKSYLEKEIKNLRADKDRVELDEYVYNENY